MEFNRILNDIKARDTAGMKLSSSQQKWLIEQADKVGKLEKTNKEIASKWVTLLISYLELMDESYPEWRTFAEKEIQQLKTLLKK